MLKSIILRLGLLLLVLPLPLITIHAEKAPQKIKSNTSNRAAVSSNPFFLPLVVNSVRVIENPPLFTTSYYWDTINATVISEEGRLLGELMAGVPEDDYMVAILDFCQPWKDGSNYGVYLCDLGGFVPISQIETAVKNFAIGYYTASADPSDFLTLVVGTNNYGRYVECYHGIEWAGMVNRLNDWLVEVGFNNKIYITGGNDMELGFNSFFNTRDWINGYNSINKYPLYDFGDAQSCPTERTYKDKICTSTAYGDNYTWYMSYVRQIAFGTESNYPLPLIYNTLGTNAKQWYSLSSFSVDLYGGKMEILGAVTQWQACQTRACPGIDNEPAKGWQQLYDELNKDPDTAQSLLWSTDFVHNSDIP